MNRIDELKSLIENCKKTIESSEKEIEMLKSKEPAFERVEEGKKYYFVDVYRGKFFAKYEIEEHSILDDKIYASNNYFLARERAKEVADKINFLLKLERLHDIYCPDYKPDWNDERFKWYVLFDCMDKEYIANWTTCANEHAMVYFDSEKTAEKVCAILSKELENEDM